MNKEEIYRLYEYHSTKTNKELRKIFDNANWNYNIQLFRSCEEIINELKQENNDWKFYWSSLNKQVEKLSIRIDKAIEYIKSFGISDNDLKGLGECPITMNDLCNLLEILKGVDNE